MYVNSDYAERDLDVLHDTIEAVRFGVLALCADGPLAAHIPFVLHREEGANGTLYAHVARADPLARHLGVGAQALAIFSGPRAYISPRWYPNGGLPTYNYTAVHAYGRPRLLEGREEVLTHLTELVDAHEERFTSPWSLQSAAEDRVERLLEHIAPFSLEIEAIQGKRKLSQNRAVEDRDGVIGGLRERGGEDEHAIAQEMSTYPHAPSAEHA